VTATINRVVIIFFTALLFAGSGLAAYFQESYFLLLPFGVLALLYLAQNPDALFYVLVGSIPWSVEFNFTSSLGTDLPDEPLMLLTTGSGLIWLIYQRKKLAQHKLHPLVALLFLQFLWTVITVIASTDAVLSVKYLAAKCWYLGSFIVAPLLLFRNEKNIKRAAGILMTSMLLFMFIALIRHAQNGWTFEKINNSLRPFFRNHVNYSALLVFMVPLQIAFIRLSDHRWFRRILIGTLVITIGALYFSYARGAWLALLTGTMAYWLIRKRKLFLSYVVFFVVSFAALFWLKTNDNYVRFSHDYRTTIFHKDFREHLIATYQLKDVSTAERFYRWIAGVRMVKDHWETGFGPTTFYDNYKSYGVPAFKTWVSKNEEHSTAHNYFLLMAIEQGLIGLVILLFLIGLVFWYAQKIYHRTQSRFWKVTVAAAAAIMVMQCTVNFLSDMVETDKIGGVFYLCIAVIIMADIKTREERSDPAANV
jgi:O-antigen ligase